MSLPLTTRPACWVAASGSRRTIQRRTYGCSDQDAVPSLLANWSMVE